LPHVEFVGELDEADKMAFLDGARALLFPIDWPEPFGLVMIEAMACGTPVVAFRRGSVPEVVDEGITGYIVDDATAAVAALAKLDKLDRRRIGEIARQRFSAKHMAGAYLRLYDDLLDQRQELSRNARRARAVGGGGAAVAIGARGAS
jgi:glycosyltransferase involved in cell wall biosynthesis